ncbi:MAG: hypothetical protein AAB536_01050 [Patescibacteria group bacterium]
MPINFRSKIDQKLLGYYFANPGAEHYLRELSRILSFNASFLSRELKALTANGIFISSKRGREKYFRLNRKHPLYNEIRAIIKSMKS